MTNSRIGVSSARTHYRDPHYFVCAWRCCAQVPCSSVERLIMYPSVLVVPGMETSACLAGHQICVEAGPVQLGPPKYVVVLVTYECSGCTGSILKQLGSPASDVQVCDLCADPATYKNACLHQYEIPIPAICLRDCT
jgi:hypothetical protein